MAQSKIEILMLAKDRASKTIQSVSREMSGLNRTAGLMTRAFGAFGAIAAGGALAGLALESARAASAFNTLKSNMDQLAGGVGQNADMMLESMRQASRGMISDTQLVQSANRAMLLGVADSAEEMGQLLEVAIKRGAAMGLTAEQAFNDLVTGIGRMSPMILDNLGIVTGGQAVYDNYAASIGKAADALTDAEKKQALLNQVLSETGTLTLPVNEMERMYAAIDNAKVAMGQLFAPAILAAASAIADEAQRLSDALNENVKIDAENVLWDLGPQITQAIDEINRLKQAVDAEELVGWMRDLEDLPAGVSTQTQAALSEQITLVKILAAEYNKAAQTTGAPLIDIDQLENGVVAFREAATSAATSADTIRDVGAAGNESTAGMDAAADAAARLAAAFQGVRDAGQSAIAGIAAGLFDATDSGLQSALSFYDTANHELQKQITGWQDLGLDVDQVELASRLWVNDLREANKETTAIAGSAATVNSEYSKLQSTIAGIISSATGPVAGVNAEDFLPREDAVNENARRLADIMVNGFKGQDWLDEFAREVPDIYQALVESGNPQEAAARMLKDFQDGLVPSLIDKEKAKDLARRAILGDRNAKQLADEIAAELAAEMGVSLYEARSAAGRALGTGTDTERKAAEAITVVPRLDTTGIAPVSLHGQIASIDVLPLNDLDVPCIPVEICPPATGEFVSEVIMGVSGPTALAGYENAGLTIGNSLMAGFSRAGNPAGLLVSDIIMGLAGPEAILAYENAGAAVSGGLSMGLANSDEMMDVGSTIASAVSTGFGAAFEEQYLAQYMAMSLAMQVEENAAMFEASGRRAAMIWGPAFLAQLERDLPLGLINALAAEVTPLVENTLMWRESLNNASSE